VSGIGRLNIPDEDVIKEDYVLENFEARPVAKSVVSDKFLQFLVYTGIPIASIGGQAVELPSEYRQMQEDIRASNYSAPAFQNLQLRQVSAPYNKDIP